MRQLPFSSKFKYLLPAPHGLSTVETTTLMETHNFLLTARITWWRKYSPNINKQLESRGQKGRDYRFVKEKLEHYEKGSDFHVDKNVGMNNIGKNIESVEHVVTVERPVGPKEREGAAGLRVTS